MTATTGLRKNWKQFTILVIANAFVGGMIGTERSIFPTYAAEKFGITSNSALLTFIIAFGFSKAITNYITGRLANRFGRKNLLIAGWILAIPVPLLLMQATAWHWVIMVNILLGIHQGLTWSSTVVMKIDLVGEKDRGLAMGLNEFAGYLSVGIVAWLTGFIAARYGIDPYTYYLGLAIAITGLLITVLFVKDTRKFVVAEKAVDTKADFRHVFMDTSFRNKTLSSITQAGLVNNLNDGMIWGLFPILLMQAHYDTMDISTLTAIYPAVWGLSQLFTGKLADLFSSRKLIFWGMLLQGLAIIGLPFLNNFLLIAFLAIVLGLGTALVYPTFLAGIAKATPAWQRAESIGTFRLWRDAGYAFGAILSGLVADWIGISGAIITIGGITILSAVVAFIRMPARD